MDRDELRRRLLATYQVELEEHARALNRDLLALENDVDDEARAEHVRSLFRTVHSLKSASRSVSIPELEALCHHLEDLLLPARDGGTEPSAELTELLFEAADALEDAARRLQSDLDFTGSPAVALLERLARGEHDGPPSPPAFPRPSVTPPSPASVPAAFRAGAAPPDRRSGQPVPESQATIRIAAHKLDRLLSCGGELRVTRERGRSRLADLAAVASFVSSWEEVGDATAIRDNVRRLRRDLDRLLRALAADSRELDQAAGNLERELYTVRLLPFSEACEELARHARDLAHSAGKEVKLAVEGGAVEIDRSVAQRLRAPLLHLVRNAIDHGIELPDDRRAAGKPGAGHIVVRAESRGDRVHITVSDDGRGIDTGAIRSRCEREGRPAPERSRDLGMLIFEPGFTTTRTVSDVSGRGVGLDAVRTQIESLHGAVDVDFEPGRGARFSLLLPLDVTAMRAVMLRAGGQIVAVPATNVITLARAGADELGSIDGSDVLLGAGGPIPARSLADAIGLPPAPPRDAATRVPVAVLAAADTRMAFAVDELVDERDVVVRPLGPRLRGRKLLSGTTMLPNGTIVFVLNAAAVLRQAGERGSGRPLADAVSESRAAPRLRLLVVDDSVTTRTLQKSILEDAGFEVLAAADGQEAWELLRSAGDVALVVSDVEMPRMDGFQLTAAIRSSKQLASLPVVLVTALESDEDRARGMDVGADAYLPKSAFDQKALLSVIGQLVDGAQS